MRASEAIAFSLLLIAGCVGAPDVPVEAASLAATTDEPLWSEATRRFDVEAGDTFGVVVVNFTQADGSAFLGDTSYLLMMDTEGLGEKGYAHISAHFIKGEEATWGIATQSTGGRAGVGGTDDDGGPPRVLFFISMHAEERATLRLGAYIGDGDMPTEEVAGTWLATGPAQVSYLHAFVDPLGTSYQAHAVEQTAIGTPFGSLVAAGDVSIATKHAIDGASFEFSSSVLGGDSAGAGVVDVTWKSGNTTRAGGAPYAPPGAIGSHVAVGPAQGETASTFRLRGADAMTFLFFNHLSAPFDIETLGLHQDPVAYLPDFGPLRADGACIARLAAAVCV